MSNNLIPKSQPQEVDNRWFLPTTRTSSPLLYAHLEPNSSLNQAEAPVKIGWQALTPAIIFTSLATLAVVLRWYSRARLTRTISLEDWFILFSLILSIAMTCVIGGEVYVAGKMVGHKWSEEEVNTSKLAKLVLCSNLLYQILINTTKSTFLIQYLRLFHQRWMRYLCRVLLFVLVAAACYGFFGALFMCTPVQKYWHPRVAGTCKDAEVYWIVLASIGISMDFVIWIIPMPLIKGLRLPLKQRISLAVVFALGGFVCIVSILRMGLVHMYATRNDMEHAGVFAILWSTVEANVGIICASLMVLKPLVAKVFPKLVESTSSSEKNLRLPTITETNEWGWDAAHDATCVASRPVSWVSPPADPQNILVTMDSVVEKWNPGRRDSEATVGFGQWKRRDSEATVGFLPWKRRDSEVSDGYRVWKHRDSEATLAALRPLERTYSQGKKH